MIYVDPLYETPPTKAWPFEQAAHLFCLPGSEPALKEFGELMEIRPDRYRPRDVVPHWELTAEDWKIAVEAGATKVSREGMVEALRIWRAHWAKIGDRRQDRRKRRR